MKVKRCQFENYQLMVNIHIRVLGKRALVIILLNGSSPCVVVGVGRGERALRGVTSNS